jgi:hypothetical protein
VSTAKPLQPERAEPKSIAPAFPATGHCHQCGIRLLGGGIYCGPDCRDIHREPLEAERRERLRLHDLAMLQALRERYMDEDHAEALRWNREITWQRQDPEGFRREIQAQRRADQRYAIEQEGKR